MKIEVKQEHIDEGVPGSRCLCPVALAITEVVGRKAYVTPWFCYFYDGENKRPTSIGLPAAVIKFALMFDDGDPVEPFTFEAALNQLIGGKHENRS